MVEFKGTLSEDVKHKAFLYHQRKIAKKVLVGTFVVAFLTLAYSLLFGFNFDYLFKESSLFLALLTATVILLIFSIVYFLKPVSKTIMQKEYNFSILFDGSKVIYAPLSASYGKREFGTVMINKFEEFDDFYYLKTEGRNEPYICEKRLLVQGDFEEFKAILKNAKFKKVETSPVKKEDAENASSQTANLEGSQNLQTNLSGEEKVNNSLAKTRFGRKIRQRLPREKEYRWAVASIICSIASVALVQPFLTVGFSVIDVLIPKIATFFFSHVVELFTAVFAVVGTAVSTFVLVFGLLLLMPIGGLLSLIFSIVQLTRNRRWWSWFSFAVSLASIAVIFVQIATFN